MKEIDKSMSEMVGLAVGWCWLRYAGSIIIIIMATSYMLPLLDFLALRVGYRDTLTCLPTYLPSICLYVSRMEKQPVCRYVWYVAMLIQ